MLVLAGAVWAGTGGAASQAPPARPNTAQNADPLRPEPPPSEATLGVAVFPGAQFLRSYDAGRGQRFYLYGASASFAEVSTGLPGFQGSFIAVRWGDYDNDGRLDAFLGLLGAGANVFRGGPVSIRVDGLSARRHR